MKKGYWFVLFVALAGLSSCVETYNRPSATDRGRRIYEDWYYLPKNLNTAVTGVRLVNEALTESALQRAQRIAQEYDVAIDDYTHTISEPGAEWQIGVYDYKIEDTLRWSDFRLTCIDKDKYEWKLLPQYNDKMELQVEVVTETEDRAKPISYYKVNGKGEQTLHDYAGKYTYIYSLTDVEVLRQPSLSFAGGQLDLQVVSAERNDTISVSVVFLKDDYFNVTYNGETSRYLRNRY